MGSRGLLEIKQAPGKTDSQWRKLRAVEEAIRGTTRISELQSDSTMAEGQLGLNIALLKTVYQLVRYSLGKLKVRVLKTGNNIQISLTSKLPSPSKFWQDEFGEGNS